MEEEDSSGRIIDHGMARKGEEASKSGTKIKMRGKKIAT